MKQQKKTISVCTRGEWHYCQLSRLSLWISFLKKVYNSDCTYSSNECVDAKTDDVGF